MIFCARGYDEAAYGLAGAEWEKNVTELVYRFGIDLDMSHFDLSRPIAREEACQLAYNAFVRNLVPQT
ncbi:MAG: hypothetical protein IJS30_04420 [Bacteroidales bacterium]|nr:hypothetical protein [Bacteroidales bacterium]